jgi:hypothetical protein
LINLNDYLANLRERRVRELSQIEVAWRGQFRESVPGQTAERWAHVRHEVDRYWKDDRVAEEGSAPRILTARSTCAPQHCQIYRSLQNQEGQALHHYGLRRWWGFSAEA